MFFKLKKRCLYCAHVLDAKTGKCVNPECIAYTPKKGTNKKSDDNKVS